MTYKELIYFLLNRTTEDQIGQDVTVRTNDGECYPVTNLVLADESQDQLDIGHIVLEIPIDLS